MKELERLINLDELKGLSYLGKKGFIHNRHCFTLPLVLLAQRQKILPQPCNLILFDKHHDFCNPWKLDAVTGLDINGISVDDFIMFCDENLRQFDDDWITSGMEMGLLKDLVIFGVQQDFFQKGRREYIDHKGIKHNVYITGLHPGEMFCHQGELVDQAKDYYLQPFLDTIGWHWSSGFISEDKIEPFLLDFDLDCFSMQREGITFPWSEESYETKYLKCESNLFESKETGKAFLQTLINRSSLFTIAKEPSCCGGEVKCSEIYNDFNKYIFDNKIKIVNN